MGGVMGRSGGMSTRRASVGPVVNAPPLNPFHTRTHDNRPWTMMIGAQPAGRGGERWAGCDWVAAWGHHPPAALGQGE